MGLDFIFADFFGVDNAGAGTTVGQFAAEWVKANWDGKIDAVQVLFNDANGETVKKRVACGADVLTGEGLIAA
ncbi:MAG: hypothetical protein GXY83_15055, partial [Rhodopirellula sp.]|nr:hypothetical protein [Rhodopirellula sp.]